MSLQASLEACGVIANLASTPEGQQAIGACDAVAMLADFADTAPPPQLLRATSHHSTTCALRGADCSGLFGTSEFGSRRTLVQGGGTARCSAACFEGKV